MSGYTTHFWFLTFNIFIYRKPATSSSQNEMDFFYSAEFSELTKFLCLCCIFIIFYLSFPNAKYFLSNYLINFLDLSFVPKWKAYLKIPYFGSKTPKLIRSLEVSIYILVRIGKPVRKPNRSISTAECLSIWVFHAELTVHQLLLKVRASVLIQYKKSQYI